MVLLVVPALLGLAGCGGGSSRPCSAARHEPLDPRSDIHLLPGAPTPTYATDPPTSGPHRVGSYPRGVLTAPLTDPVQVALLEKGFVLIQYRSGPGPLATLAAASPYVTVAPNPTLPADVVATAWQYDQRCSGPPSAAMVGALRAFIASRVGRGPEAPPA